MRNLSIVFGLVCIASIAAPLVAQQPDEDQEWFVGKPMVEFKIEGASVQNANDAQLILNQYLDRPFSFALLQNMLRSLYALEYFEQITPVAEDAAPTTNPQQEVAVLFEVTENAVVDAIRFEGNARISDALLNDEIVLKPTDILTNAKVRSDVGAMEELYLSRGFPNVEIDFRIEDVNRDGALKTLIFDIVENEQLLVREIAFEGNFGVGDVPLQAAMITKAQSLFERGELSQITLEQDKARIEEYYRSQGYVYASVLRIEQNVLEDTDANQENRIYYRIDVVIDEGIQYTYGGVSFAGNQIYTDDELLAEITLVEGSVLNVAQFEVGFQRVVNLYFDNGYIFNTINYDEQRDDDTRTLSYVVNIVERDRAHIENIVIRGNTKTKEHVILREFPFEVGEVFSADTIRRGILNLYNLQYFSNILPETPIGSTDGLMELIVNVEEGMTADIRFGLSFGGSSDFPIALQVGWQDRNFLGEGLTLGAEVIASIAQQRVTLNFVEPWLGGERLSLGVSLNVAHTLVAGVPQDVLAPIFTDTDSGVPDPYTGGYVFNNDTVIEGVQYRAGDFFPGIPSADDISDYGLVTDYEFDGGLLALIPPEYLMEYDLWTASLGLNIGYRIPTPIGLVRLGGGVTTAVEYVDYNPEIYRPYDQLIRNGLYKISLINSLALRVALDDRDLYYNPSSGYYLAEVLTFTGGFLFGERHLIRSDTRLEGYLTLVDTPINEDANFKVVLGAQSLLSIVLPHFFVPDEFAGRPQPIASSQELLYIDGIFYGRGWPRVLNGEMLWDSVVEVKIPIAEQFLWFDSFFEAAALWSDIDDLPQGFNDMFFTFGGGVRFTIPQFPIRLYFVKRFQIVNGGVAWQQGTLFNSGNDPTGGIDFVFTIGSDLF